MWWCRVRGASRLAERVGIVVLDAKNDSYRFVSAFRPGNICCQHEPRTSFRSSASPVHQPHLMSPPAAGLGAIDMGTDKMGLVGNSDGKCAASVRRWPDGRIVVVGGDLQDYWYEVDARRAAYRQARSPEKSETHTTEPERGRQDGLMSPNTRS